MPSMLAGDVSSVEMYSSLPPVESSFLDSGKYSSNANDGRDHFRFSKEGGSYPDGSYVVAKFKNGNFTTFRIEDSSSRN